MLFGLLNKDEKKHLNNPVVVEVKYGDETLRLETGRMAKQANGNDGRHNGFSDRMC